MPDEQFGGTRLDSWKSIAAHLGRDVRTVMRWEQTRGLPIRRIPGENRSAVYAFRHEIDAWLTGQSSLPSLAIPTIDPLEPDITPHTPLPALQTPSQPRTVRWILAGLLIASLLTLIIVNLSHLRLNQAQPAAVTFTTDSLQAWDAKHRLLWEHRFSQPFANHGAVGDINPISGSRLGYESVNRSSIQDLHGDGKMQVLAITLFRHDQLESNRDRQVLSCFGSSGKLLWSYEPQTVLTFGNRSYSAPWSIRSFILSDEPGRKTIWINVVDYVWGKSFIAKLDADGHSTIQFVQSGEIAALQRFHSPKGAMLWIGGFNDEYDTASLAIMPDSQPYATSPQTPGSHFACNNCGTGNPTAYFVFPRYDISRILHNPNNKIYDISSTSDEIELHQAEVSFPDQILYDFSTSFPLTPLRVNYSATFWANHLELERQGKTNHTLQNCPDRLNPPPIRVYQDGAWRIIKLPSVFSK